MIYLLDNNLVKEHKDGMFEMIASEDTISSHIDELKLSFANKDSHLQGDNESHTSSDKDDLNNKDEKDEDDEEYDDGFFHILKQLRADKGESDFDFDDDDDDDDEFDFDDDDDDDDEFDLDLDDDDDDDEFDLDLDDDDNDDDDLVSNLGGDREIILTVFGIFGESIDVKVLLSFTPINVIKKLFAENPQSELLKIFHFPKDIDAFTADLTSLDEENSFFILHTIDDKIVLPWNEMLIKVRTKIDKLIYAGQDIKITTHLAFS